MEHGDALISYSEVIEQAVFHSNYYPLDIREDIR